MTCAFVPRVGNRTSPAESSAYLREKAAFWLGAQRGHEGLLALRELVRSEQDGIADTNSNFAIRKEAIFWLGQTNDPRALAYMEQVLQR
jgi:HEAT repeat protein